MLLFNLILCGSLNEQIVDMTNYILKENNILNKNDNVKEFEFDYENIPVITSNIIIKNEQPKKQKGFFERLFCCFYSNTVNKPIFKIKSFSDILEINSLSDNDYSIKYSLIQNEEQKDKEVEKSYFNIDRDSGIESPVLTYETKSIYKDNSDNISCNTTMQELDDEHHVSLKKYDKEIFKSTSTLKGSFYRDVMNEFDNRMNNI